MYSNGDSERIVGKAIKKYQIPREELVLLTKVFMVVQKDANAHPSKLKNADAEGYANLHGLSRKHIFDSVKASLERMQVSFQLLRGRQVNCPLNARRIHPQVEYVDVLQCHRFDPNTPIEETMDALHDVRSLKRSLPADSTALTFLNRSFRSRHQVVKAGLARYIGMSSCYAWQFHAMQNYAKSKNQTAFISMQDFYNPVYREEVHRINGSDPRIEQPLIMTASFWQEREMFPTCKVRPFPCRSFPLVSLTVHICQP